MRPSDLHSRIFLDGGDPAETREIIDLLGFLDGQTTNPSLIAKNPEAKHRLDSGKAFSEAELLGFYKQVVQNASPIIPDGSVSIEVYSDDGTSADEMLAQAREMFTWIPNAHIKFPTTEQGLTAAEQAIKEGMRVNMTLVFTQAQAAAVYAATRGARPGDVFVSPFIGRLDDRGENGMDLIANILRMYEIGDGHVQVLTASVRSMDHFLQAIRLRSDIITTPQKVLKEWGQSGMILPGADFLYRPEGLAPIAYQELDINADWRSFDISHELTDIGMQKFSADWNKLMA